MKMLHAHRHVLRHADLIRQLGLPGHVPLGEIGALIRVPQQLQTRHRGFLLGRDDRNLIDKEISRVVKAGTDYPKGREVRLQRGHGAVVHDTPLGEEEEMGKKIESLRGRLMDDAHDDFSIIG